MKLARTYLDLFRRNPSLARLLAGEFISGIGDWLYLVAILVVVYAESESPVLLGIVGAARILPYVLLSVPAGMAADRFDRRMVLLVTDIARGILMVVLVVLVIVGAPTLAIIAVSVLAACFSTFFGPAIASLLPMLVDERDLGPANSAWATLDNIAFIVGPAVAGVLLASGGLEFAFALNAVSFAVVAIVLWRLEVPQRKVPTATAPSDEAPPPQQGFRDLLRPLAGPFVLDAATSIVGGGISVMTVVIAVDVLGAGEAGTGYLNAATGVGGVVAGVAGGALLARRLHVPLLLGGIVGGAGLAALALTGDLALAMVAIGVAVAGLLLLEIVNTTLIQRIVPDQLRGRAMGILQTSSAVLYAGGSLVMPLLADAIGVTPVLVGAGALVLLGVVGALLLSREAEEAAPIGVERSRLLEHPIFAGLPTPRLEAAARDLGEVPMAAGDVVVRQGDAADRFYLIAEGTLRVTQTRDGKQVELRTLGPGDVFGEVGLLNRSPRTATVTALTDGRLLALDGEDFLELVSSGPGLSSRLLDLYRGAISR
ncbi:MAG TPA: MFS transporter [Candidatus Limnocylindria bacterium]|nr:MFS transporter [Candidatus Limnocylindria bacterium]